MGLSLTEILPDSVKESLGLGWRRYRSVQNLVEGMRRTVQGVRICGILAYRISVQVDAGKDPVAARPGEQFSTHAEIG